MLTKRKIDVLCTRGKIEGFFSNVGHREGHRRSGSSTGVAGVGILVKVFIKVVKEEIRGQVSINIVQIHAK